MTAEPGPAERLLHELGVTAAGEIDVELIARSVGVSVRYRRLSHCDARIVGLGDRAIITVDERASRVRQRFSIAHELGHWHYHRGRQLICRLEAAMEGPTVTPLATAKSNDPEREADRYAADLLMPAFLVNRAIEEHAGPASLRLVQRLAEAFGVSLTAAAMRVVERSGKPVLLIVRQLDGRCWFRRSPSVPRTWFIRPELLAQSRQIISGGRRSMARQPAVPATHWFAGAPAGRRIAEETLTLHSGATMSLLTVI